MTTQSEELVGKCARLLRASRVPPSGNLRNVRIDWGHAGSGTSAQSADMDAQPSPRTSRPQRDSHARGHNRIVTARGILAGGHHGL